MSINSYDPDKVKKEFDKLFRIKEENKKMQESFATQKRDEDRQTKLIIQERREVLESEKLIQKRNEKELSAQAKIASANISAQSKLDEIQLVFDLGLKKLDIDYQLAKLTDTRELLRRASELNQDKKQKKLETQLEIKKIYVGVLGEIIKLAAQKKIEDESFEKRARLILELRKEAADLGLDPSQEMSDREAVKIYQKLLSEEAES